MRYFLTPLAESDVRDILEYLRKQDPRAEKRVRGELFAEFREIGKMPNTGHRHRDVPDPVVRVRKVYSYLIFYNVEARPVEIYRVLHGKRNIKRIFRKA